MPSRPSPGAALGAVACAAVSAWIAQALWATPSVDGLPEHPLALLIGVLLNVFLVVHQGGHLLFMATGVRWLVLIMGTGAQLLFGAALIAEAARRRSGWLLVVCWNLMAVSLYSAATYIADARDRALPLITDDPASHNWGQLVYEIWQRPGLEITVARIVELSGWGCSAAAVLTGLWLAVRALRPQGRTPT